MAKRVRVRLEPNANRLVRPRAEVMAACVRWLARRSGRLSQNPHPAKQQEHTELKGSGDQLTYDYQKGHQAERYDQDDGKDRKSTRLNSSH